MQKAHKFGFHDFQRGRRLGRVRAKLRTLEAALPVINGININRELKLGLTLVGATGRIELKTVNLI